MALNLWVGTKGCARPSAVDEHLYVTADRRLMLVAIADVDHIPTLVADLTARDCECSPSGRQAAASAAHRLEISASPFEPSGNPFDEPDDTPTVEQRDNPETPEAAAASPPADLAA